VILAGGAMWPSLGVRAMPVNALVMDCCRVALSRAKGEGVFGMAVQSSSSMCLHLWAMGRSHSGVELNPLFSLFQWSGFVDESIALRYVRAARSG